MHKPMTVFVLEGESKEVQIVNMMENCFLGSNSNTIVLNLPAQKNIYMLYQELKENDFEIDLIELLRSDLQDARELLKDVKRQQVDQIYLFFDYDPHQDNLPENVDPDYAVDEMLDFFVDETDQGKLYISYPMSEAIYDLKSGMCQAFTNCLIDIDSLNNYKHLVGVDNPLSGSHFKHELWEKILNQFLLRIRCLFDFSDLNHDEYLLNITPKTIYYKELDLVQKYRKVFILSAFPEFLFDYYRIDFWKKYYKTKKFKYYYCPKGKK